MLPVKLYTFIIFDVDSNRNANYTKSLKILNESLSLQSVKNISSIFNDSRERLNKNIIVKYCAMRILPW